MLWTFIKLEITDFDAKPYIYEPPRNVQSIYHVPIDNECIKGSIQYTIIRRIMEDIPDEDLLKDVSERIEDLIAKCDKQMVDFLIDYTHKIINLLRDDKVYIMPMYFKMFNNGTFDKKTYEN